MNYNTLFSCNTMWTAIGAVGQWLGALATLGAVIVALKPYKRKLKIELESVVVKLDGESQILPSAIRIYNKGYMDEKIVGFGVISSEDVNLILSEEQIEVEKSGIKRVAVKHDDVWNALRLVDNKFFRIWIQDSAGYKFYSKPYCTDKYRKMSKVLDSFN